MLKPWFTFFSILAACSDVPASSAGSVEDDVGAVGCSDEVTGALTVSEIGTAPRLAWTVEPGATTWVEFSNGAERTREAIAQPGEAEQEAILLGIVPNSAFTWEIFVSDASGDRCVASGAATNGALPAGVPAVTATAGADASPGLTLVPALSGSAGGDNWLLMFDEAGRVVWAYAASEAISGDAALMTAAFSRDGTGVLFNGQAESAESDGWIAKVGFDGSVQVVATVTGIHTDFAEMRDGRIAALTWEVRQQGDARLLGDHITVIDAAGEATSIWNSFDSIPFIEGETWVPGFYPPDATVVDWSHVNSISWDEASDDLVVTMTAQSGLARVDAQTGETELLYGIDIGAFGSSPGLTEAPHSAEILENGNVLVFNRGDFFDDPAGTCSWAAELGFDVEGGVATELHRWDGEECTLVTFLGQAHRLPGDVTLLDWTSAGRLDQLSADDETLWSVSLAVGHAFGYADFLAP